MIHVDGKKLEMRGKIPDLVGDASNVLAGVVTIALNAAQEEGVPDKELESAMNDLIAMADANAKKIVREYLKERKEEPCEEEEKSDVPEL